jgi:deazaflavin-dependent oxidoreductase (nitroreductase family)
MTNEQTTISHLAAQHPVRGLLRFGVRLPLWLYRLHLGWLLGERLLRLTHIGRKSGQPRQTVLEVVDHDRTSDSYIVTSGWGEKSDWYQNILKTPQVRIDVGRRHLNVTAELLSKDEAEQWLFNYAQAHARTFQSLVKFMIGEMQGTARDKCQRLAETMPVVAFRPRA